MTPREFCYWLQGFFELCEAAGINSDFDKRKFCDCVQAHINVVKKTPGKFSPELLEFMVWMQAAIDLDASLSKISEKLNSVFVHVIDPSSQDDGSQLAAHQSSGGWESSDPLMRC